MHAGPLITTPSALLLFSLSPFVSPVLSSSYFVSVFIFLLSFLLVFFSVVFLPHLFPRSFSLCHSVVLSFCLFSFLSPALLLTSSAVLRPLHEANAHSGLAVAACMRSTGGPIKRRQEQEMERETGSARPQGPRRYHHCPLLMCPQRCLSQNHLSPPPSFLPSSLPHFVCPQLELHLRTPLCVSSGCWLSKNTSTPSCVCLQLWLPQNPRTPFFCNPKHCTFTPCCMCVCVFSSTHT